MLDHKTSLNFNYRIKLTNREIHYCQFIGKVVVDISGNDVFVGITKDIMAEERSNTELEARNNSLLQTNKQLASFNHIASYDLQEPLRKIQTFVSRINNDKLVQLGDKEKGYFKKIEIVATRMRKLIDDLLLFSRVSNPEAILESCDLNKILKLSIAELLLKINETNTTIIECELPVLNVIPFQIQQLSTNILSNSIKYSKKEMSPIITIRYEKISGDKLIDFLSSKQTYPK